MREAQKFKSSRQLLKYSNKVHGLGYFPLELNSHFCLFSQRPFSSNCLFAESADWLFCLPVAQLVLSVFRKYVKVWSTQVSNKVLNNFPLHRKSLTFQWNLHVYIKIVYMVFRQKWCDTFSVYFSLVCKISFFCVPVLC